VQHLPSLAANSASTSRDGARARLTTTPVCDGVCVVGDDADALRRCCVATSLCQQLYPIEK
jgi:hypothetical protein